MKAVVCDDDVTLRGVVGNLASVVGYNVLAETDSAPDAVHLVDRFGADVLILDLALPWGSGRDAVRALRERRSPCRVVVFTSFATDDPDLRGAQVRAVVEKPDFDRLEHVLRDVLDGTGDAGAGERRKQDPARPPFPTVGPRSPSGLEDPLTFEAAATEMVAGDAVLVVRVSSIDGPADLYGRALAADRFLAVARSARAVLRVQDRMTVGAAANELALLLVNAGRAGVESVWRRLEQAHDDAGDRGTLSGGWAVHEPGSTTSETMRRAHDAAARSVGQPAGDRLWAG